MVVVAVQQIVTFLLVLSAEAFIFESDDCNRYHDYADLISLAHVENCLSVDQVFSKLKRLGDFQNQNCFRHVLDQLGDRYGVSVRIPEDCQCNGTNTLLTYEYQVIQGTADYRRYCMGNDLHYRALFDAFFKDNGNLAPACRSHHSVWYDLSRIQDNTCARDLIYHLKYAFDRHPSQCSCQQSLQYGDPNNCSQFHSYQALLRLKELCTSKNSLWDLLHDLELRSPVCRKDIITDLTMHLKNALAVDQCTCYSVASISNEEPSLEAGQLNQCSDVRDSSYNDLRQSSFGGASNTDCATHYHLWQQLHDIQDYNGYDCTMDFILRAANKYPSSAKDPCHCSGSLPTTTTTTTTTHALTTKTTQYTPHTSHTTTRPTPVPQQSNCSEFNSTVHRCHDSSACFLPHILEVLCPDPQQARYCAVQCGCCQASLIG